MGATIPLDEELVALLQRPGSSLESAARELIVFELYREGVISVGRAAELLHLSREQFTEQAAARGVPYFDMTDDEWEAERRAAERL